MYQEREKYFFIIKNIRVNLHNCSTVVKIKESGKIHQNCCRWGVAPTLQGRVYLSTLRVPRVISALYARILLSERKIANSSNSQHGGQ